MMFRGDCIMAAKMLMVTRAMNPVYGYGVFLTVFRAPENAMALLNPVHDLVPSVPAIHPTTSLTSEDGP